MAQRAMRVPRRIETVEFDQKIHLSLASTAKMFERSENYCWYELADAFKLKRYDNENGTQFFNKDAVKKAKARWDKLKGSAIRMPSSVIRQLRGEATPIKTTSLNGSKPVTDDGVPVVEIDADMLTALIKKGAITVRMKS